MNKLSFAALVFAAFANSTFAAGAPKEVRVALELTKNDKRISDVVNLTMVEGQKTPYSDVVPRNYVAVCEPGDAGMIARSAKLSTGLVADVIPVSVTDGGAMLSVAFSYVELDEMKTAQVKGCTIEMPTSHGFVNSMMVQVKPGQEVEIPSYSHGDKYRLVIRGL